MILDVISNLNRYNLKYSEAITRFIAGTDCPKLPVGEIEIQGRNLFVRVMEYTPKPAEDNKFETHRIYADVQYMVSGIESMQVISSDQLTPLTEYDTAGDYQFFKGKDYITDLIVRPGQCAVFLPGEAHRPSCLYNNHTTPVKKLVFKVRF